VTFKFEKTVNEKFKFNSNAARRLLRKMDSDGDHLIQESEFVSYFGQLTNGLSDEDFDTVGQHIQLLLDM
jgi:hypothetical protein